MGLFSFFNKEKKIKCDWCKKEIKKASYIKYVGERKYIFCSENCKKNFRKYSNKNKGKICPTCKVR